MFDVRCAVPGDGEKSPMCRVAHGCSAAALVAGPARATMSSRRRADLGAAQDHHGAHHQSCAAVCTSGSATSSARAKRRDISMAQAACS